MNSEHKKYILENMYKKSAARIASELGIRERKVKRVIEEQRDKGVTRRAIQQETQPTGAALPIKKTFVLASIALIIILGFAVYANSLNGKFVYDDDTLIANNSFVKNWSLLPKVFSEDIGKDAEKKSAFYRPIQMVTYAMDYHIWGLSVVGYHLTNVILHIFVALCVFWLINLLFKDRAISVLTAALFVIHPINTTVVSYISTRAESLYLFFMLLAFICYIKSIYAKSPMPFIIMLLSYSLSLLSKENALIFPALIFLYHYTFSEKARLKEFLSIAGIAFIYILLRTTVLKHLLTNVISSGTLFQRIPGFFAAIATYTRLLFLPFGLHIEYGSRLFNFMDPRVITGMIILIILVFCLLKVRTKTRLIFFSFSWLIITLLPVSNLYPLNAYMSENWLYLPSIGFYLLVSGFLIALYRKKWHRPLIFIFAVFLLVFYSYLTIKQNRTWADPISFYERTLKYSPDSARVYNNLGIIYNNTGKKDDAMTMYKKAIESSPNYSEAYINLGIAYFDIGRKEDAIVMYKKAIELNPYYSDTYYNLGIACYSIGRKEDAIAMYKKAIEINHNNVAPYINLANIYDETGRKEDAIAMYKKAIELNPYNSDTYYNLGIAYHGIGRKEDAIAVYKKVIELNPNHATVYNEIGTVYFEAGRRQDAAIMFRKALEINPDDANARRNLEAVGGKQE